MNCVLLRIFWTVSPKMKQRTVTESQQAEQKQKRLSGRKSARMRQNNTFQGFTAQTFTHCSS